MSNPLFDISQYQSETQRSYSADWRDAIAPDSSWDDPDLKPNSEFNIQQLDNDTPSGWQSAAFFTITLESGQTVEVKFVPGVEGELAMHQFDFTGPVSPTGFKSQFVLAVETEEFPRPRDYAQAYAQDLVAQFEEKQHMSQCKKRARLHKEMSAPQELLSEQDNFTFEPAMAEDTTQMLNQTPVEVVEELSPEDAADRQRLELKVERAFYEAGCALRELRDRRLYRSTHKTWEQYCQDRFGYTYRFANLKISAADVFDNLLSNCSQAKLGSNCSQILPTRENQCRELAKLDPEQQPEAWIEAIQKTPGEKMPTASTVKAVVLERKGIVERLKQKNPPPLEFAQGDVVEIQVAKRSLLHPFNGMCGIIEHIGSFSYTVRVSIARDTQQCKGEEMIRIDDEYTADIRAVAKRIELLVQNSELESIEYDLLANLQRSICFTPTQLQLLEWLEERHVN